MKKTEREKAGYLLPEIVDPDEKISVCVPIPNDKNHVRAFLGQLDALARWWTWDRDTARTGKNAASVWARIAEEVRGKIDNGDDCNMTCCHENRITRVTNNGQIETSDDGGLTWSPAKPGDDARLSYPIMPIPASGGNLRCELASSATYLMQDAQAKYSANLGQGKSAAELVAAILAALVFLELLTAGFATVILMPLIAATLGLSQAAFDAAFTAQVWEYVQCAIYCRTKSDGSAYTEEDVDIIRSQISGQISGVAALWIDDQLKLWRANLLTNAARSGFSTDFDCSTCECPDCLFDYDFRVASHQFSLSAHVGSWVSGQGWEATFHTFDTFNYYTTAIEITFPDGCTTPLLHWEVFYADTSGWPSGAQIFAKFKFKTLNPATGKIEWIDNGWNASSPSGEHSTDVPTPGYSGQVFYGVGFQITHLGVSGGSFIRRLQIKN